MAKRAANKGGAKRGTKTSTKPMSVSNVSDNTPADIPGGGWTISAILNVNGTDLTLDGHAFDNGIFVEYHKVYNEAINLGNTMDILGFIGNDIINVPTLATDVQDFVDGLPEILSSIINAFTKANIVITDFVIDTQGVIREDYNTYEIGIGLVFPNPQPKVTNIQLNGFIVNYRTQTAQSSS